MISHSLYSQFETNLMSNRKVIELILQLKNAKAHGKNYIKVKPHLVRHLLRNRLLCYGRRKREIIASEKFCVNVAHSVACEQTGRNHNIPRLVPILRFQHMLRGYANEETFRKH